MIRKGSPGKQCAGFEGEGLGVAGMAGSYSAEAEPGGARTLQNGAAGHTADMHRG